MPLCGLKLPASIWFSVVSTSLPNSQRCSSEIEVLKYWISGACLRTNTTSATSEIPLIQE